MLKNVIVFLLIITSLVNAQDFTGIRIYINPGHGGHDSDDRYIAETGFWESEGNLSKGLYLRDILNSFNATTKISRTTNNTSDDLGLSVISADANNFDADYFQSIHSNATGITTKRNTTLILFRGYDSAPVYPESKVMGNFLVDEIYKAHRTLGKSVRGDWDFYDWGTQGLGVLRGLTMPGTLSEGSFHDYIPESWRLRNLAYLKHEAWAITKAFIKYFELENLPYGEIAGILRDPFSLVNYVAITSADEKKPLNLVKATLLPGNKLYLGDALNNGFYMFDKVMPGEYSVVLEAMDTGQDTVSVTVTAGNTTFADRYLFAVNQRKKLSLLSCYPTNTSSNISSTVKIKIHFDGPINSNTLGGNVSFQDDAGNDVPLKTFDEIDYENGWIIFEPDEPLENNSNYTISVLKEISDIYGLKLDEDIVINFKVEPATEVVGSTLIDFEEIGDWWQPAQSGSTLGIDANLTTFSISSTKAIDGDKTGKLTYQFSEESEGICRIYNQGEPELNTSTNLFGMWVFGDLSYNILEYWFRDNQGTNIPIIINELNWTGWKFMEVDLTSYSNLKFHSMVITQNNLGEKSGQIYFDAMLMDVITDVNNLNQHLPTSFKLEQNYPNPFNPTTTIKYTLPTNSFIPSGVEEYENSKISPSGRNDNISLIVYDVLGREIITLVNESQPPGIYEVTFDATDLTSGIYYYQLKTGDFIETKKMILLK